MSTTQSLAPVGAQQPDASAFPPDFVWGAATASYQIEGAVHADGRGTSIWDTFSAVPGRVRNGDTGEVAVDHYRRYRDDVDLMAGLGLGAYRFSLAWPRIQPTGSGRVNAAGLAFYDRLVDELLERGITPWATLYHWDLPQPLEDAGGWPHRDTAARFAEFAHISAQALGDRVQHWITLNEPWCSAFLGYGSGRHAPGRTDPAAAVHASHHLLLGHGLAVEAIREVAPRAQVGITLNLYPVTPRDDTIGSAEVARRIDGLHNRWFLDPLFTGGYPVDVLADVAGVTDQSWLHDGDLDVIGAPLDMLGVNYYTRHVVRPSPYPGSNVGEFDHQDVARTASGWDVDPQGLHDVLTRVHDHYTELPVFITENGSAWHDELGDDGRVADVERTSYLSGHLLACQRAIEDGVPLGGYFAWSLRDNFEWAEGYAVRFGLVHVDYASQARTVKDSGHWYSSLIADHRRAY
jgi:beta-glucosidase